MQESIFDTALLCIFNQFKYYRSLLSKGMVSVLTVRAVHIHWLHVSVRASQNLLLLWILVFTPQKQYFSISTCDLCWYDTCWPIHTVNVMPKYTCPRLYTMHSQALFDLDQPSPIRGGWSRSRDTGSSAVTVEQQDKNSSSSYICLTDIKGDSTYKRITFSYKWALRVDEQKSVIRMMLMTEEPWLTHVYINIHEYACSL